MEMSDLLKKHFEDVEAKIGPLSGELKEVQAHLRELEQLAARRAGRSGSDVTPTWGSQFVDAKRDAIAAANEPRGRVSMEIKAALTSGTGGDNGAAGDLVIPTRDGMVGMPRQRLAIRDLLTVIPVASGSVEYVKQTVRELNADVVEETTKKPESHIGFELLTTPTRTIAHYMKASRQIMEDVKQLQAEIDTELRYGLALVEEEEILYGDGTGQHLEGLTLQATTYSPAFTPTDMTPIDEIGLAILQAAGTNILPDGIVVHPTDWWRMRLTKDAQGRYILGDPGVQVTPGLFGLPIVPTPAMTEGNFLVGAFKAQRLYDRWTARVEVGFDMDDFTRNMVTILGEERVALAAKSPEALIDGAFSG